MTYPTAHEIQNVLDNMEQFAVEKNNKRVHDYLYHATSLFMRGYFTEPKLIEYNKKQPWDDYHNLRYPNSPLGEFGEAVAQDLYQSDNTITGDCSYPEIRTKENEVKGIDLILTHKHWQNKREITVQVKVQTDIHDRFTFYREWLKYARSVDRLWVVDPFVRFMINIQMPNICLYAKEAMDNVYADKIVIPYDSIPAYVKGPGNFRIVHE